MGKTLELKTINLAVHPWIRCGMLDFRSSLDRFLWNFELVEHTNIVLEFWLSFSIPFFLFFLSSFLPFISFFFFFPLEQKRCRVLINATNPAKSEILVTRFSIVEKNYRGIVRQTWRLLPTAVLIMYGWKPWIETVILKYYFVSDVFTSSSALHSVFRRFRKSVRLLWTIGRNYQRIFTISPWLKIEEKHRNESLL